MIFLLDCSPQILEGISKAELGRLLSLLIEADRSGKHLFLAHRAVTKWVMENVTLSDADQGYIIWLHEQYTQRGSYLRKSKAFVKIMIGDQKIEKGKDGEFSIGHKTVLGGEYLSRKAGFVVEDVETDWQLYKCLLNGVSCANQTPGFACDPVHGGGSRIGVTFENEIRKAYVVVCLADGDEIAPQDRMSKVARRVVSLELGDQKGGREVRKFIGLGAKTLVREAENYIPYEVLQSVTQYKRHTQGSVIGEIVLRDEKREANDRFWPFFDIKRGIILDEAKGVVNGKGASNEVVRWLVEVLDIDCDEDGVIRINGFGDNVIRMVLSCKRAKALLQRTCQSRRWLEAFGAQFETLLWFFAASPNNIRT